MAKEHPSRRAILLAASAAGLAGCGALGSYTLGYRLTVRMLVFGEPVAASSTFKVVFSRNPENSLYTSRYSRRAWGEAIVVDLGERGALVGILGSVASRDRAPNFNPLDDGIIGHLLPPEERQPDDIDNGAVFERVKRLEGERPWPLESWPQFLLFADRDDVNSAQFMAASPEHRASNTTPVRPLADAIGGAIENVTVRMMGFARSDERIERALPLVRRLPDPRSRQIMMPGPTAPLAQRLMYRHFKLRGDAR